MYNKEYYKKNKQKLFLNSRLWKKNNKEKFMVSHHRALQKYIKTPKGIYRILKANAVRSKREFLEQKVFIEWYNEQNKECFYCGIKENANRMTIDRMDNDKGYLLNNLALACGDCNKIKSNILTSDEMKIVGEIVMKKRWKK